MKFWTLLILLVAAIYLVAATYTVIWLNENKNEEKDQYEYEYDFSDLQCQWYQRGLQDGYSIAVQTIQQSEEKSFSIVHNQIMNKTDSSALSVRERYGNDYYAPYNSGLLDGIADYTSGRDIPFSSYVKKSIYCK